MGHGGGGSWRGWVMKGWGWVGHERGGLGHERVGWVIQR